MAPETLDTLIREQARDERYGHRVFSISLDRLPDVPFRRRVVVHDLRHGTVSFYVGHRCRCSKCRAASAEYQRERRHRNTDLREREAAARAALRKLS